MALAFKLQKWDLSSWSIVISCVTSMCQSPATEGESTSLPYRKKDISIVLTAKKVLKGHKKWTKL